MDLWIEGRPGTLARAFGFEPPKPNGVRCSLIHSFFEATDISVEITAIKPSGLDRT
jgi:hypothetical protein